MPLERSIGGLPVGSGFISSPYRDIEVYAYGYGYVYWFHVIGLIYYLGIPYIDVLLSLLGLLLLGMGYWPWSVRVSI